MMLVPTTEDFPCSEQQPLSRQKLQKVGTAEAGHAGGSKVALPETNECCDEQKWPGNTPKRRN